MTDQTKKKLAVAGGIIFCAAVLALLTAWRMTPQPLETALPGAAETRLADGETSTPRTPAGEYPGAAPDMASSEAALLEAALAETFAPEASPAPGASRSDAESASAENFAPTAGASENGRGEATNPSGVNSSGANPSGANPAATDTPNVTQAAAARPDAPVSVTPVVIPPTNPRTTAAANAPDMEGAEQSIQPEVTRPTSARPDETHERPDDPALLDPAAPPATSQPSSDQPEGGETKDGKVYVPGFGWIKDIGEGRGTHLSDMYENGNKIGIMD
jgi:hypothetical protein